VSAIPQRVHLIGLGGIHMSAIARILRARGHTVSGSDIRLSPLTQQLLPLGVTVYEGHHPDNIKQAQLVVYTSAAHDDNPELQEARRRGVEAIKRADMVARLMAGKKVIAVAGTHGKTTTTSLIAYMLHAAGLSPAALLGGESVDLGGNALPGEGPYFVAEADEYDRAFLSYHPYLAIVTNIEPDHPDIYGSFDELRDAFRQFISQIDNNGHLIACSDSPALQALLPPTVGGDMTYPVHVASYGLSSEADWVAGNISRKGVDGLSFVVQFQKQAWGEVETRLPGIHNVTNSLGAIAAGHALGLAPAVIRDAVASFRGVRRRFEHVGGTAGVTVIDDYAHHPTEIRATLAAARERFPARRAVCLFQPHTYSRTALLLDEFRTCFAGCDLVFITDTYAAREEPSAGMDAQALSEAINHAHVTYAGPLDSAVAAVAQTLHPGDVVFTIGAGDVERAGPAILRRLEQAP
jgi:UDP-N-acetylmuramate--alanine ligase